MALTVAVTGPTGEIGISAVEALERHPAVDRIIGMARRPFDPAAHGWTRTEYRQGDITDRDAVDALVADADVVIHLAFIIMGSRSESARVNLEGTRNLFEATVASGADTKGRGVGGVGDRRQIAVRSVGAGMAARRADIGGDGHVQGQDRAGLDTEIHGRRNIVGVGGLGVLVASRRKSPHFHGVSGTYASARAG